MTAFAFISWDVNPVLVEIGPVSLRWYGLLFMLGFVTGYQILEKVFKKEGVDIALLEKLALYVGVGTIAGARLGHCLFYQPDYYLSRPWEILMIHQGGLASHGAAVGILLSLYWFTKKTGKAFLWTVDRLVITVALGAFFIRMGNLMNSEIVGEPTQKAWGFIFKRLQEFPEVARHPTQIYEGGFYLFTFVLLYFLYWKTAISQQRGKLFGIFLILVFGFRIGIEFLKENQVEFEQSLPLNMGQLLSLPFVLTGIYLLTRKTKSV